MNINIPQNTFEHKEPREEMVQKICDVFLKGDGDAFSTFQVATDSWGKTTKVIRDDHFLRFDVAEDNDDPDKFIRESEMALAFNLLRDAGYHVFYCPHYGRRTCGYEVIRRDYPRSSGWYEVDGLKDHWD